MLQIQDLSKRYGDLVAAADVALTVPRGRLVGFVGPNGAGKSTVMRSIFGLVNPDRGTITWEGEPAVDHLHRFGYLPEQRGLYPKMKIREQVAYFARLKGIDRRTASARAADLLTTLDLGDRLDDPLEKLSHGNQQRVQLAVALANDPDLLVLDEPFNGLDPVALVNLQAVLEEQARNGTAVLFSSHQLDLVERLCHEVVMIAAGRVRRAGRVADVRASTGVRHLTVEVETPREPVDAVLRRLVGHRAAVTTHSPSAATVRLEADADVTGLLAPLSALGRLTRFDYDLPSLESVFTDLVTGTRTPTDTDTDQRPPAADPTATGGIR